MGLEYNYSIERVLNDSQIEDLFDKIKSSDNWRFLAATKEALLLKFHHSDSRAKWNEDFEIRINGNDFYVCFHTGNKAEINFFQEFLEREFQRLGVKFLKEEE